MPDKSFHLLIYNILDEENAVILRRLMKIYGVPESGQQVPLLFSRSSYLSGAEKIVNGTVGMLESGEAQGSWKDIIEELAGEKESDKISKSRLAVTGFFNGLNPCGISMLLMVLSILLMSKRSFYGGSFTYLAGNLVIYLIAMCVPMVLLTVLVSRGKSVMSASHLSLKILPVIKLVSSIFFFVLFFTLLF